MRNHFNSSRRWSYIIVSVVGGRHRHYIVSDVVDKNSLYQSSSNYDSKYDNYRVADYANGDLCTCYNLVNVIDKSGCYLVNNIVNSDSSYVILYRDDYNK